MLTIKSNKTSLLDLSIDELRKVEWGNINFEDFSTEINNINFLTRFAYADEKKLFVLAELDYFIAYMQEEAIRFILDLFSEREEMKRVKISASMFYQRKQYSFEFIEKYKENLHLNYIEHQQCLTPEFIEEHLHLIDKESLFSNFNQTFGADRFNEFIRFNGGVFREYMLKSESCRYMTKEQLIEAEVEVPEYYDTVLTEQRVMSGDPCSDGQRSFTIWLRKYRRVFNDPTGYPTWNDLLEVFKQHRRMNDNGYIDWLFERALFNTEEYVAKHSSYLEYRPEHVSRREYVMITETVSENDYEIEFNDVLNPGSVSQPVQELSVHVPVLDVQEHTDAEREDTPVVGLGMFTLREPNVAADDVTTHDVLVEHDVLMELMRYQREYGTVLGVPSRSWNDMTVNVQPMSRLVRHPGTFMSEDNSSEQTERDQQPRDPYTGRFISRS